MLNERTVRGTYFTCFHVGPKETWTQYRLEPPDVPLPARGSCSCGSSWGRRAWRCR
jgi:hypothetical protein